jgi:hypothetical protein
VFVVALDAFDKKLYEDKTVNRMMDSLQLFEELVNSKWMKVNNVILVLNRFDLFQEKYKKKNITDAFPDYRGSSEKDAIEYILNQYMD